MNKKISIEITQEEYDALAKAFEAAKNSKFMSTKALNIDDFVKEIVVTFAKGPNLDALKNMDPNELLGGIGSIEELKDMLSGLGAFGDKENPKKEEKKDEIPDEQKYKS